MAYSGTGAPPGAITYVLPGDSAATIQSKLNSVQPGNSLVFTGGATYDFGGVTIAGKSGVTVWADGQVVIANAPGAGTHGAFDFSGKTDWTIGGRAPGEGFVFNGSLIDATNASGNWTIGNAQFNNQQSNGYDGSAIRMNGASFGTIINNDFNGAGGNVIGMYNLTNITIDGNRFTDCYEPISIQEPTTTDTTLGHDIIIRRNVFEGTQRAAIEVGPASSGSEYFSGIVVDNNYFDNFNNTGGDGTLLPISLVGQSSQNTTITNNFIRRGPADAGEVGVAIEMTGTGVVSGNTIANFSFAVLTYQSGWNVYGNTIYNDGSSPYYGFANNGSGTGTFGAETILTGSPAVPAKPARVAWGGSIGGTASAPTVAEGLASDTGGSSTDRITSNAALSGTADANAVVRFTVDGTSIAATAAASPSGIWSFTPAGLADGSHTVVASVTNSSGASGSASLTFTLDTKAPVPLITGASFANGKVTLAGTSEAGSAVSVYEGWTLVGIATAGSDGKWTMTGTGDGTASHWYGAVATDLAGNVGHTSSDYATTPSAPAVTVKLVNDTGGSATDQITSSATLTGTADANAVVRFMMDGTGIAATATANASGTWSLAPTGLADGSHTVVASVTSASGMTGSSLLAFTLDTKAPVPVFTGIVPSNGLATLTGSTGGATGEVASIYDGNTWIGSAATGTNGSFSFTISVNGSITHAYSAVVTDLAGNVGTTVGKAYLGSSRADMLTGTSAGDLIQGGAKADTLKGGGGADRFVYRSASDSTPTAADIITDFLHGVDKIDFSNIAGINTSAGVPQFQGKLAGTGSVKLNAHSVAYIESGGNTQLLVNTSNVEETVSAANTRAADMKITLVGVNLGLTATDFSHL